MNVEQLKTLIRNIPDFPMQGIEFKDITPILANPVAFKTVVSAFCVFAKQQQVTAVLAPEARGFIFAVAVAYELGVKFVPARKPGKLPDKTYSAKYELEYGSNSLEIHKDALTSTDRVIIIDDLIATSGTIQACIKLVKQANAEPVCIATLIALKMFKNYHNFSIPLLSIMEF